MLISILLLSVKTQKNVNSLFRKKVKNKLFIASEQYL